MTRSPWWTFSWFLVALAVALGAASLLARWWGTTTPWLLPPLLGLLLLVLLGARRTSAPNGAYGIAGRGARSEGRVEVPAGLDDVPSLLEDAVARIPSLRVESLSPATARVTRGLSWWSWGERITLRCRPVGEGFIEISARCAPTFWLTVYDWGQGAADLELLFGELEREASRDASAR
ncbi:hypothetical protein [Rothia halotolerans]|uniref:hypothetical protein n=1 Tax=Rothia halotolerans TaxID=405770 RepID=UPI00101BE01E|nr:hypothetical protein [Rothia halotolerans]